MNFWKGTTLILTGYVLHEAYPLRFAKYRPGPTIGDTLREIVNRKLNYIFLGSEYPKSRNEYVAERRNRIPYGRNYNPEVLRSVEYSPIEGSENEGDEK